MKNRIPVNKKRTTTVKVISKTAGSGQEIELNSYNFQKRVTLPMCSNCGEKKREGATYCSNACRQMAYRLRSAPNTTEQALIQPSLKQHPKTNLILQFVGAKDIKEF